MSPASSTASTVLLDRLARAGRVAVLTGAGVSAESGVATFRDPDGLWARFRPEELARVDAFLGNPERVQGWYAYRRGIVHRAEPNPAHRALARLERMIADFTLITQNVDDLHRRGGSSRIVELHGNLTRNYCVDCRRPTSPAEIDAATDGPVRCPACGGLVRPDVVWFGEMLPEDAVEAAWQAAARAEVFLSIGTSAVVHPAAELPLIASASGAYVAEINVERSAIADALDEVILGPAGVVLPALVDEVATRLASARLPDAALHPDGRDR